MQHRFTILALATAALISGCGTSTNSVNVDPSFDTTAPGSPGALSTQFDSRIKRTKLSWEPSSAADVASYQVYTYDPDPLREAAYAMYGEVATTDVWMPYVPTNTTMYVRVRAVDAAGNAGAFTTITAVQVTGSHFEEP